MAYQGQSPRWKLPIPGLSDSPVDLNDLVTKLTVVLDKFGNALTGTYSNRGTPPVAGTYVSVDRNQIDHSDGSNWHNVWTSGDLKLSRASAPPDGWLLCDGRSISRTQYSQLFAAIGTSEGDGDGLTTFNLPDYRGRTIVGAGAGPGLTARAVGQKGGEENHLLSGYESGTNNNAQTQTENGTHTHNTGVNQGGNVGTVGQNTGTVGVYFNSNGQVTGGENQQHVHQLQGRAADQAHNTMQPFGVANVFIKI